MSPAIRSVLRLRSVATIREDPNRIAEWPRPQVALSAWAAANRRITASSVGPAPPGAWPPCVLVLLGFRWPCTNELTDVTTRDRPAGETGCQERALPDDRRDVHGAAADAERREHPARADVPQGKQHPRQPDHRSRVVL